MTYKTYIIEYTAKTKTGVILKDGTMKVKRKQSSLEAQVKFEAWLKSKYPNFGQLIVHSCYVENPLSSFFGGHFDF